MIIPQNSEGIEAGELTKVRLLKDKSLIDNTLISIGSHDILMDIVSDIIARNYNNIILSSTHVGSMGGLLALKRNETITFGLLTLYTYINLSDKKQDLNDAIKVAISKVSESPELTPYLISFSIREILNVSRSALAKCTDIIKSGAIDFLNLGSELSLSRGM